MANVRIPDEGPMRPGADDENGVTRRDALVNGAKLVVAAGIGAQIMAATGAETAVAKQVRSVAGRAAGKPGYGPLVKTGPMQLPAGFQVLEFGKAGSPMSDGNRTPKHHDGSTLFDAGNGRLTMIRNQERAGHGRSISEKNAYDRHAKGGVTTSLFDTGSGELIGSSLVGMSRPAPPQWPRTTHHHPATGAVVPALEASGPPDCQGHDSCGHRKRSRRPSSAVRQRGPRLQDYCCQPRLSVPVVLRGRAPRATKSGSARHRVERRLPMNEIAPRSLARSRRERE